MSEIISDHEYDAKDHAETLANKRKRRRRRIRSAAIRAAEAMPEEPPFEEFEIEPVETDLF